MKKAIIFSANILAAVCLSSFVAGAQDLESGYFLDNYTYGYRLNPALMTDNNFVAVGIGNISAGITSRMGVGSFVFPGTDGRLVTGFNNSVSSSEFLSKFSESNKMGEKINVNLLSFGIRKEKSMTTVELNMREDFATALPRDMFAFLKEGSALLPYDFSPLSADANAMIELALGHTRKFGDIVLGVRAKFLFGAARGELGFDRLDLTSSADEVTVDAKARLKVACKPLEIAGSSENPLYFEDVKFALENFGVAGFGMGFDLGAKWYVDENLTASLAITDLGAVSWKYNNVLTSEFNASLKGLENVKMDTDVGKAFEDFWKEIEDKAKVELAENTSELAWLPFSANAGVRYRMPFYDKLSVGALVKYDYSKYGSVISSRAGLTFTPVKWFSITGNLGYSNYGGLVGCMTSLTVVGINIFAGFDGYCGKCSSIRFSDLGDIDANLPIQSLKVPLNPFQYRFSAGINIRFGKRHADYIKDSGE